MTAANPAVLVAGNRFQLWRETETPGTFEFVALGTTVGFTRSSDFEDATAPDLTDPLAPLWRESSRKSRSWDLSFSGRSDAKAFEKIEADEAADAPRNYQIKVDHTAAAGGKTYTGPIYFESLELAKSENGFVTYTAKCRGDGAYTTTAASA
jgi:hypothetical protein